MWCEDGDPGWGAWDRACGDTGSPARPNNTALSRPSAGTQWTSPSTGAQYLNNRGDISSDHDKIYIGDSSMLSSYVEDYFQNDISL